VCGDVGEWTPGTANKELIEYAPAASAISDRDSEQQFRRRPSAGAAAYGFEDLVDEIVYSHEAGMSKPDPRIYALVCSRLDVQPEETVFLDDVNRCVVGAREAGIHAILYQDNAQATREIEKLLTGPAPCFL
jgi:FMN phosphatase YigB (HAD superfamily)